jgi:hypothetical protein
MALRPFACFSDLDPGLLAYNRKGRLGWLGARPPALDFRFGFLWKLIFAFRRGRGRGSPAAKRAFRPLERPFTWYSRLKAAGYPPWGSWKSSLTGPRAAVYLAPLPALWVWMRFSTSLVMPV